MKKIQKIRLGIQLLCVVLTIVGLFTNFQVTMVIIMAATFLGGAYFCGWVCPFGTLQDLSSKLGKALKIKKRKMPKAIQKYLQFSRYILFAAFAIFSFDILFTLFTYDPRANLSLYLSGMFTGIIPLVVLLSFLIIGMFFERPFCNYLCIEGAKYGAISALRVFTVKRDESSCVGCTKCDKVCPMNIEVSKVDQVQSLQCINCFECVSACPVKNTLSYEKISFTDKMKDKYTALAGLVAAFAVVVMISTAMTGELPFGITFGDDSETETAQVTETIVEDTTDSSAGNGSQSEATESVTEESSDIASESSAADEASAVAETEETSTSVETVAEETTGLTDEELASVGDAAGIADGVYEGTGDGFRGEMTVEVTIVSETITKVEVTDHVDDDQWFERAYDSVPDEIIDAQSVDVDTVSGATYSSLGIIDAVTDALENAGN